MPKVNVIENDCYDRDSWADAEKVSLGFCDVGSCQKAVVAVEIEGKTVLLEIKCETFTKSCGCCGENQLFCKVVSVS